MTTLTDVLRDLTDDGLVALLRLRPDLVVPAPADLSVLAARAQSRISVVRALDRLDRFHLELLDALRLTRDPEGRTSIDEVLAIAAAPPGGGGAPRVRAAVRQLHVLLLVYGSDDALRVVATVDEVLGPYPAGLGRPAGELAPGTADLVADPARLRRTLLTAPPAARAVLERLATSGPVGTARQTDPDDLESPVGWLISHGLLVATGPTSVELPREVGWLLRRETGPLGTLHPEPPPPTSEPVNPTAADAAGAGQAMEVVRHTEALLEALAADPAPVLRTGGMGVRDLRRLARAAGVAESTAALLFETAWAAGLVGVVEPGARTDTGRSGGSELLPTAGYDAWRGTTIADRWHQLTSAWLVMTRAPGLVGQRDERGRLRGALGPEVEQSSAPATRRAVLDTLANLEAGAAPTADEVLAALAWRAPRRAAGRELVARHALREAAEFGVTGRGALTCYGAAMLAEVTGGPHRDGGDPLGVHADDTPADRSKAAAVLDGLLPDPVSDLVVQADLTVVVPGPPEPTLAAELDLVAEPESAGGASVHRLTRDSLRRALDAGYTAEDLHSLFQRRSRTQVPQALAYLIDDVARAHGGLRVSSGGAYLRSQDEALVTQVLADRRLGGLGLRRLAPTVLASAASTGRLLAGLRSAGYAPVPEDGSGAALVVRPRSRRAGARPAMAAGADPFAGTRTSTPRLLAIVEDMRRGDALRVTRRAAAAGLKANGQPPTAQAHAEAMAVLQQAVRDRAMVWVGYIDARGTATQRLLRPVSIGAGYLRAEDDRTDTLHTIALHRITGAARES
jgi:hypothetical protein